MAVRRRKHSESGQAILEFAVMLPVFVLVGFVLVDIQWLTRDAAALEYIVEETARCEAIQSPACSLTPGGPQAYAVSLAQGLHLSTGPELDISTPPCNFNSCVVTGSYRYHALGIYFPAITITRTGTAAVSP